MLRIPGVADTPPPLLATLRRTVEEPAAMPDQRVARKRRIGGNDGTPWNHSWDLPALWASRVIDKRQWRILWLGGGVFSLIVAAVAVSMIGGRKAAAQIAAPQGVSLVVVPAPDKVAPQIQERTEASILAEIEPLARKFLEARTVAELLPLVRNPAVAADRMKAFYPNGKVAAPGMAWFNSGGVTSARGKFRALIVTTGDQLEKQIAFFDTPQGMKVDWESWVGWSDISWERFMTERPVTGHVFRVTLSPVEYYNFGFSDEEKWQSYRMESPNHEHALYGYVERGSKLAERIRPAPDVKNMELIVSLKYPVGATSSGQVEIERFVNEGWVQEEAGP